MRGGDFGDKRLCAELLVLKMPGDCENSGAGAGNQGCRKQRRLW